MLARLALRNLLRQRRRTLLVLLAVALGTMAVTGVRGFLNGLQRELVRGFAEAQVGAVVVQRAGFAETTEVAPLSPAITVTPALLASIERVDGVRGVTPRLTTPALVSVGDESTFALVVGVDPAREPAAAPKRPELVVEGAWLDARSMLLGLELAQGLSAARGAVVTVLGNDRDGVMNAVEGTLAGTVGASTQGEKKLALVPLVKVQELLRMPGEATEIIVGVSDLDDVDDVAARVGALLGPDYAVRTWKTVAAFANDVVQTQEKALGVVIVIFLFVILMGLMNAMLATVLERTREIGTMVALGARRRSVVVLFVLEALFLGLFGALVGAVLGALVVLGLGVDGVTLTTPGSSLPQHIHPYSEAAFLVRIVLLGTAGAALAALYPAWHASRLDPVRALASS